VGALSAAPDHATGLPPQPLTTDNETQIEN
jgi:hypothetical protein